MKRARDGQKSSSVATRRSQRCKENKVEESQITKNEKMEVEEDEKEVQNNIVLPIKSKGEKLKREGTRSSKRIAALASEDKSSKNPPELVVENSKKELTVRLRKIKPDLQDVLVEKVMRTEFFQPLITEEEIVPPRVTRSSQRIASQTDKKNEENLKPSKTAVMKLPRKIKPKEEETINETTPSNPLSELNSNTNVSCDVNNSTAVIDENDAPTNESFSPFSDVDFTQLSTFDLLKSTNVLTQSLMYLKNFQFKATSSETLDKILMPPPSLKSKKVPKTADKKLDKMRAFMDSINNESSNNNLDLEDFQLEDDIKKGSYPLVEELMSRSAKDKYAVNDCDEDPASRKSCLSNFFPGYDEKYAEYSKHSGIIKKQTYLELENHFNAISHEIKDIFEGRTSSVRNNLFLRARAADRKELKELYVSIPFTSQQGMTLIASLYNLLIPKMEERLTYSNYISSVLLPETYIRMYARINHLSYKKAELEMRFGACYDETKE